MKSLQQFIQEAIDDENIYWKIDIFFQKDNFQKSLFNALFIDGDIDKAVSSILFKSIFSNSKCPFKN